MRGPERRGVFVGWLPLSPALSPLVPRGERKSSHSHSATIPIIAIPTRAADTLSLLGERDGVRGLSSATISTMRVCLNWSADLRSGALGRCARGRHSAQIDSIAKLGRHQNAGHCVTDRFFMVQALFFAQRTIEVQ